MMMMMMTSLLAMAII